MFGRIFRSILARQVARHGSVAALAIGALASALGIPLAPEQISLLITAFSVIVYIWSHLRTLWNPPPPTALALLALALASSRPAHADEAVTMIWSAVTTGDDDTVLSVDNAVDRYGLGCSNVSEADVIAAEGDESKYAYVESVAGFAITHTFAPGTWYCLLYAHNATGWSSRSNTLTFTVAAPAPVKRRPHAPVLRRQ